MHSLHTSYARQFDVQVRDGRSFHIAEITISNEQQLRQSLPFLRSVDLPARSSLYDRLSAAQVAHLLRPDPADHALWGALAGEGSTETYAGVGFYVREGDDADVATACVALDPARPAAGLARLLLETVVLAALLQGFRRLDLTLQPGDVELRRFVVDAGGLIHLAAPDRLACTIELGDRRRILKTSLEFRAPGRARHDRVSGDVSPFRRPLRLPG